MTPGIPAGLHVPFGITDKIRFPRIFKGLAERLQSLNNIPDAGFAAITPVGRTARTIINSGQAGTGLFDTALHALRDQVQFAAAVNTLAHAGLV